MHENGNFRIRLEIRFSRNLTQKGGKEIISRRKSRVINTWTSVVA